MSSSNLLIVMGKNIGLGSPRAAIRRDPHHLSPESRMNTKAAGLVYQACSDPLDILFSGGHTAGSDIPAEAEAMEDDFIRQYPDFPGRLLREAVSLDTPDAARKTAQLLRAEPDYDQIDLLSVGHHAGNAAWLMRRKGVPIDRVIASEIVLAGVNPEFVTRWASSRHTRWEVHKEQLRSIALRTIDPYGWLQHTVARRTRG